jgi:hypothetical protein
VNDATPGVKAVWTMIKNFRPSSYLTEFIDQYEDVANNNNGRKFLGFGIMKNI